MLEAVSDSTMLTEYIQAALDRAEYKIIDNGEEPYFVEVPELDGVWATGRTVEDAQRNFIEALEDWISAHLLWNLALPPIGLPDHKRLQGAGSSCLSSLPARDWT